MALIGTTQTVSLQAWHGVPVVYKYLLLSWSRYWGLAIHSYDPAPEVYMLRFWQDAIIQILLVRSTSSCYHPMPVPEVYKPMLLLRMSSSHRSSVSASESYKPLLWTDPAPSTILPLLLRCTSSSLLTIPCFLGIQAPDPLLTLKHSFWLDVPRVVLPKVLPKVYSFSALPYGPLPWNSCLWLGHWYLILLYFAKINK